MGYRLSIITPEFDTYEIIKHPDLRSYYPFEKEDLIDTYEEREATFEIEIIQSHKIFAYTIIDNWNKFPTKLTEILNKID